MKNCKNSQRFRKDGEGEIVPDSQPSGAPQNIDRRTLLRHLTEIGAGALAAAMGGGTAIAMLAEANPSAQRSLNPSGDRSRKTPTGRKYHYGMVIDTRRCVGCRACVAACKMENKTPPGITYMAVMERPVPGDPYDRPRFLARPCNHCENPACVPACPVKAVSKRTQDGIVVVDYDRCKGYQRCVKACPYGALYFDSGENYPAIDEKTPLARVPSPEYGQYRTREEGKPPIYTARKCTFCMHLQDANGRYNKAEGRWPACAKTCTGHAIFFGDFMDPNSEVARLLRERKAVRLKEEAGTKPNVYYLL